MFQCIDDKTTNQLLFVDGVGGNKIFQKKMDYLVFDFQNYIYIHQKSL